MITVEKYIQIKPNRHSNAFEEINKSSFDDTVSLLGTTNSSIRDFRLNSELIANVMPMALGISPEVKDVNWNKYVLDWALSFSQPIDLTGYTFNCSFQFSAGDLTKKNAIAAYCSKFDKLKGASEDVIEKFIATKAMNFIENPELCHKLGTPVDPEAYIKYRLSAYNAKVAKAYSALEPTHTFYIYNKEDEDAAKASLYKTKKDAQAAFTKLSDDPNSTQSMIGILCHFDESNIEYISELKSTSGRLNIERKLDEYVTSKPEQFLNFTKDPRLEVKFVIRALLYNNILTYLEGSMAIADAMNKDQIIGSTIDEAASWFNSPDNEAKANGYRLMINNK